MKLKLKISTTILFITTICLVISSCQSPATTKVADAVMTDTVAAEIKTEDTKNVAEEKKDTVAKVVKAADIHEPLTLTFENLESATAPVVVGVYSTKNKFPDPKDQMKEYKFKPHGKKLTVKIPNLKFGTYALAIYQDVNSSGMIDKNFIGIPTEPYAFSNNYKPTVKAPNFDDCKFEYNAKMNVVTMSLIQ